MGQTRKSNCALTPPVYAHPSITKHSTIKCRLSCNHEKDNVQIPLFSHTVINMYLMHTIDRLQNTIMYITEANKIHLTNSHKTPHHLNTIGCGLSSNTWLCDYHNVGIVSRG